MTMTMIQKYERKAMNIIRTWETGQCPNFASYCNSIDLLFRHIEEDYNSGKIVDKELDMILAQMSKMLKLRNLAKKH